jgi:hypothetical protein
MLFKNFVVQTDWSFFSFFSAHSRYYSEKLGHLKKAQSDGATLDLRGFSNVRNTTNFHYSCPTLMLT